MGAIETQEAGLRKWLAFGNGVAIEIRGNDLHVTAVRVRPSGAKIRGAALIADFRQRPAAEWGKVYAEFARKAGVSQLPATVVLPRRDVIVRVLQMPGVQDKDLAAAISFQLESLHPFPDEDALHSWAKLGTTGAVLVGITRRDTVEKYCSLFAEAGIRTGNFTFSAAAVYSAIRLFGAQGRRNFLAVLEGEDGAEIYGESEARPLFSAAIDGPVERGLALAAAELRLPGDSERVELPLLLAKPKWIPPEYDFRRNALAYSAALAGACPRLALPVNLLPPERRASNSRWIFVPTVALGAGLVLAGVGLMALQPVQQKRYLESLQEQIRALQPLAKKADALEKARAKARDRAQMLDEFRMRSKADLEVLHELTKILPPPTWVNSLEVNRTQVMIAGETQQAEGLLKTIDASPLFKDSQFAMPIGKSNSKDGGPGEVFRIRTTREGAGK